ncbi:hypothetical protein [Erythrobacter sp. SD-21]|uniref:hypothetical protein n=1 Tax=Erythrobacter sp. SD-21 TaxID=161528 RepID=UPI000153FB51|nr:hypothetical protein [Erythrobacter sp. SD-21]EDL49155.1 hypothetical protein ED21_20784 [Erythrobacter sp. SD-21]
MSRSAFLLLSLFAASALSAQESEGDVTPLFASDAVLDVTVSGPIRQIARRAETSTAPMVARLEAAGETHGITLAARGKSRRQKDNCAFPPLRIAFPEKPDKGSLFHKQGRIKLVTHCRDKDRSEQTMLREYAAYRLYNRVTPESLRVRLARISYVDGNRTIAERLGFFIEDVDDAARRLGRQEVDVVEIPVAALDQQDAARYALFQYMIGNTDWAMAMGPPGDRCCHNSRLVGDGKDARAELTPIPYDFDNAGLVDARYAVPSEQLGTRSVRQRVYRGLCRFNALVPAEAERLRTLRREFEDEIAAIPQATDRTRASMASYLEGFYEDMADLDGTILSDCR